VGFVPASTNVMVASTNVTGVDFTANPPHLGVAITTNQSIVVSLTGLPSRTYRVLTSTNAAAASTNWTSWRTMVTGPTATGSTTDPRAATNRLRFYRPALP